MLGVFSKAVWADCDTRDNPQYNVEWFMINFNFALFTQLGTAEIMHVFKSRIDKWVLACLALSIIACLMGSFVMLKVGGTFNYILAAVVIIVGTGFPIWILTATEYKVLDDKLEILSGPFTWSIAIADIQSIQPAQNVMTSPALAFERLEINYGENRAIYVSPENESEFIRLLGKEKFIALSGKTDIQMTRKNSKKKKSDRKSL